MNEVKIEIQTTVNVENDDLYEDGVKENVYYADNETEE